MEVSGACLRGIVPCKSALWPDCFPGSTEKIMES